ncbi:MAG: serine protease [Bacteroidales bacterium]|jgi:S1-C subfamily serine protease
MITTNVFTRVFNIRFNGNSGTCFTLDVDEKQYFITAKHLVASINSVANIEIYFKNQWTIMPVRLIGHSKLADVSVLATNNFFAGHPLPATIGGMLLGQDIYFLGFPYGIQADISHLNWDFPMPLIKKGTLSAMFLDKPEKYFLIDGHNNPGFSGAPVVFSEPYKYDYKVAGVISGYRVEYSSTLLNNVETPIQAPSNTGIIIAYGINNALEIINGNPTGRQVEKP